MRRFDTITSLGKMMLAAAAVGMLVAGCRPTGPQSPPVAEDPQAPFRVLADCLTDLGYQVALLEGGVEVRFSSSQTKDQYLADYAICQEQAAIPFDVPDLTVSQLNNLYDQTQATRDCLIAHGFEIPQPPSMQYFVDNYYTDPYVPFAFLPQESISQEDVDRLMKECPQPAL